MVASSLGTMEHSPPKLEYPWKKGDGPPPMGHIPSRSLFLMTIIIFISYSALIIPPVSGQGTDLSPLQWRWISGSSNTDSSGVCGSLGAFSSAYSPSARYASAITKCSSHAFYLVAGYGRNTAGDLGYLGDIWAYRQSEWSGKGEWAWISGSTNSINFGGVYTAPTPFIGARRHSTVWIVDNGMYIMGGEGYDGVGAHGYMNDLWLFDLSSRTFEWKKGGSKASPDAGANPTWGFKGDPEAANTPGGLNSIVFLYEQSGSVLLFGGYGVASDGLGYLSDVWQYATPINMWAWQNGESKLNMVSIAGASGAFASSYHPGGRKPIVIGVIGGLAYVWGGYGVTTSSASDRLSDLWAYKPSAHEWSYVSGDSVNQNTVASYGSIGVFNGTNQPGSRLYGCGWAVAETLNVWGGQGFAQTTSLGRLNDWWTYNLTSSQWAWAGGDSVINQSGSHVDTEWYSAMNSPSSRDMQAGTIDESSGIMYVFGGNIYRNDLWSTFGPRVVIGASPTTVPTPSSTPTPVPPSTQSPVVIAGTVVSIMVATIVGIPSVIQDVLNKGEAAPVIVIDAMQFIAIMSQLSMKLPSVFRDFSGAFSWTLPVIRAPFDFVPARRRLLSITQVYGDAKQAALNYLPSLLFWIVVGITICLVYVAMIELIRVKLLNHKNDTVKYWRRSLGLILRVVLIIYYAICFATFYAIAWSLASIPIVVTAIVTLVGLCVGIPVTWAIMLKRMSKEKMREEINQVVLKAFISGYKKDKVWFSLPFLLQKLMIAMLVAIVQNGYIQTPLILVVLLLVLFGLFRSKPHEISAISRLWEMYFFGQIAELVILIIVSFVHLDTIADVALSIVIIVVNICSLCVMLLIHLKKMGVLKVCKKKREGVEFSLEMSPNHLDSEK